MLYWSSADVVVGWAKRNARCNSAIISFFLPPRLSPSRSAMPIRKWRRFFFPQRCSDHDWNELPPTQCGSRCEETDNRASCENYCCSDDRRNELTATRTEGRY